jgi:hypothetical protein
MAELKISPLKIFTEKFGRRMDFNSVFFVHAIFDAAVSAPALPIRGKLLMLYMGF